MKLFKLLFVLIILIVAGGFGYFAYTDVDVPQSQVTKEISNDRFFGQG